MKMKKINIKDICIIALMTAIIVVCSWMSIPMTVPVTMQTFAVFLTLLVCGGRNGAFSILIYILLGLIGVPVFSSFKGGTAALFGLTGGYIFGFLLIAFIYFLTERFISDKTPAKVISLLLGLIVCYIFGTVWFIHLYNLGDDSITIKAAITMCVIPFIIPDILKLLLALFVYKAAKPVLEKVKN